VTEPIESVEAERVPQYDDIVFLKKRLGNHPWFGWRFKVSGVPVSGEEGYRAWVQMERARRARQDALEGKP